MLALTLIVWGLRTVGAGQSSAGQFPVDRLSALALVVIGLALLLSAYLLPVVREVEFGFPVAVKVKTVVRDRAESLGKAFTEQRADLELVAQSLCDDPAIAARSLEVAWARTVAAWRGPITPALRVYVLCQLVSVLRAQLRWTSSSSTTPSPLGRLEPEERIVVVLSEFADLDTAQIASITGSSVGEVEAALLLGTARAESGREATP